MKTVLCYGDSNTWGYNPHTGERYDSTIRWPRVLQALLNKGTESPAYEVIEEGLNGRTTSREDFVDGDRNGLRQLIPILESHKPLDIVVLLLGTNDLKIRFSPMPYDIARGAQRLVQAIQNSQTSPSNGSPKILWVCPPPTVQSSLFEFCFGESSRTIAISSELPRYFRELAHESGVELLEAGSVVQSSSVDGVHWEAEGHRAFAAKVAALISAW